MLNIARIELAAHPIKCGVTVHPAIAIKHIVYNYIFISIYVYTLINEMK